MRRLHLFVLDSHLATLWESNCPFGFLLVMFPLASSYFMFVFLLFDVSDGTSGIIVSIPDHCLPFYFVGFARASSGLGYFDCRSEAFAGKTLGWGYRCFKLRGAFSKFCRWRSALVEGCCVGLGHFCSRVCRSRSFAVVSLLLCGLFYEAICCMSFRVSFCSCVFQSF